jgi:hypothetical protein
MYNSRFIRDDKALILSMNWMLKNLLPGNLNEKNNNSAVLDQQHSLWQVHQTN